MVAPDLPTPIGEGKEVLAHHEVAVACKMVVDDAWGRLSEVASRVIDEEDGVFLYKLTRLAQAYPEVMKCVNERRDAVVASLTQELEPVRSALTHRVQTALSDLSALQYEIWREREATRNMTSADKLDKQRVAASVELAHKELEANLRVRNEIRRKEQIWEDKMIGEINKMSQDHGEEVRRMLVSHEVREREWLGRERRLIDQLDDLKSRMQRVSSSLEAREREVVELNVECDGLHALHDQLRGTADVKARELDALSSKLDALRKSLKKQIDALTRELSAAQAEGAAHARRADDHAKELKRLEESNGALARQNEQLDESFRQASLELDRAVGEARELARHVRQLKAQLEEAAAEKAAALAQQLSRFKAEKIKLLTHSRDAVRSLKEKAHGAMHITVRAAVAEARRDVLALAEEALRSALLDAKTGVGPRLDQLALDKATLQRELRMTAKAWRGRIDVLRRERDASDHVSRTALRAADGDLGGALAELERVDARTASKVKAARLEGIAEAARLRAEHEAYSKRRALDMGILATDMSKLERNYYEVRDRLLRSRAELRGAQDAQARLERSNEQLRAEAEHAEEWAHVRLASVRQAAEEDLAFVHASFGERVARAEAALEVCTLQLAEQESTSSRKLAETEERLGAHLADAELRATDTLAAQSHLRKLIEEEWLVKLERARAEDSVAAVVLEGALLDAEASYPKLRREHLMAVKIGENKLALAVAQVAEHKQAASALRAKLDTYLSSSRLLMTEEQAEALYLLARTNAAKTGMGASAMTIEDAARHEAESVRRQLDRARLAAKRKAFAAQRLRVGGDGSGGGNGGNAGGGGMRSFGMPGAFGRSPMTGGGDCALAPRLGGLGICASAAGGGASAATDGRVDGGDGGRDGGAADLGPPPSLAEEEGEGEGEGRGRGGGARDAGGAGAKADAEAARPGGASGADTSSASSLQPSRVPSAARTPSGRGRLAAPSAGATGGAAAGDDSAVMLASDISPCSGVRALSPGRMVGRPRSPAALRAEAPPPDLAARGTSLAALAARGSGAAAARGVGTAGGAAAGGAAAGGAAAGGAAAGGAAGESAVSLTGGGATADMPTETRTHTADSAALSRATTAAHAPAAGRPPVAAADADESADHMAPLPLTHALRGFARARTPLDGARQENVPDSGMRRIGGAALEPVGASAMHAFEGRRYTGALAGGGMYVSRLFANDGGEVQQPGAQRGGTHGGRARRGGAGGGGASRRAGVGVDDDASESSSDDEQAPGEAEALDPSKAHIATDLAKAAKRMVRMYARCIALEGQVGALDLETERAQEIALAAQAAQVAAEQRAKEASRRVVALESHFAQELVSLKQLDNDRKLRLVQLAVMASAPGPQGEAALEAMRSIPPDERKEDDWRQITAELASQHKELQDDFAALEKGAEVQAMELGGRITELNGALERLYHVVGEHNPELLFRTAELEAMLALRDSQIARLLDALHAQRRRVSSAGDDLALALSLFPSLTQIITTAHKQGEHRGLGAAVFGDGVGKRKPRRGGNRSHAAPADGGNGGGTGSGEFYSVTDEENPHTDAEGGGAGAGAGAGVGGERAIVSDSWMMPERLTHSPSRGGLHASATALLSAAPSRLSTAVPRAALGRHVVPPTTPSRSSIRSASLDLKPIAPGTELVVTPASAARPDSVTGWLASENAYGPSNAPVLRPVRPRTTIGLHRSMSETVTAANDFAQSLKAAPIDGASAMLMPSRLPCDRSFLISTPSVRSGGSDRAATFAHGSGALGTPPPEVLTGGPAR